MLTFKPTYIFGITLLFLFAACTQANEENYNASEQQLSSDVMTAEDQAALTPQQVIEDLKAGNERYVNNNLTPRDWQAQVAATASGQYPEAVILSCLDSRVPVETVFDKGVGDIFVGRVAGNFVNVDMLGSMEFGARVAGSKVIVVMGHESCGAVKSAIDDVQLGNITEMLAEIKPAVQMSNDYDGEQSTSNNDYVTTVVNNNVRHTIDQIMQNSPILKEMADNGEIIIAGAFYDLDTGKVTFLD